MVSHARGREHPSMDTFSQKVCLELTKALGLKYVFDFRVRSEVLNQWGKQQAAFELSKDDGGQHQITCGPYLRKGRSNKATTTMLDGTAVHDPGGGRPSHVTNADNRLMAFNWKPSPPMPVDQEYLSNSFRSAVASGRSAGNTRLSSGTCTR